MSDAPARLLTMLSLREWRSALGGVAEERLIQRLPHQLR